MRYTEGVRVEEPTVLLVVAAKINKKKKRGKMSENSSAKKLNYKGPVVLAIMDGVGLNEHREGNGWAQAHAENLSKLMSDYPWVKLGAAGRYVGLPEGQMGNSEVGHYIMGAGQIMKQALPMVDEAFETGRIYESESWKKAIKNVLDSNSKLHFIGIYSDGRVHGDVEHIFKMIEEADQEGVERIRIHPLLDGRDVPARSEPKYINMTEEYLKPFNEKGRDYKIASGGGRTYVTADRYWSDAEMMKRGMAAHVFGTARPFHSTLEAVETLRREKGGDLDDQWIPEFTIVDDSGNPVGKMEDGDTVIYNDFRADRAIQFSEMMTLPDSEFPYFERGKMPKVFYVGMVEYDQDRHIPKEVLVEPVKVSNILPELEVNNGRKRFVISESIKFGHVTFYFNGNKKGKFSDEMEEYVDIPNKTAEPWQFPWMNSDDVTDIAVEKIKGGEFPTMLINYPNGDIVGHEARLESSIVAVEAVDIALGRLMKAVDEAGGVLLVTADHGNVEENEYLDAQGEPMKDENGEIVRKTSHTTNPVPFIIYDNTENKDKYKLKEGDFGLANVAATVAMLEGLDVPTEWEEGMIEVA
jgi:2,3-bisphosphoglycerate-independent phosphoglycerate mutase